MRHYAKGILEAMDEQHLPWHRVKKDFLEEVTQGLSLKG